MQKLDGLKTEKEQQDQKEKEYYDFRNLQRESEEMSEEQSKLFANGDKFIDEKFRQRLAKIFRNEINTRGNSSSYGNRVIIDDGKFKVSQIDPSLFHDIFSITKKYLKHNELVDLHSVEDYKNCECFLSEDGLSGFAITKDGDLISVFNSDLTKRGWLYSIAPFVKENAKTLDCFNSSKQPLKDIYETILGFKSASVMEFNIDYSSQEFADKHNSPNVIFMVNTNRDVEIKEFDKDSYDKAVDYRNEYLKKEAKEKKETQSKPKTKKQPKEVIKFIRQTVYLHTESAKSVKSEEDQTQLKKYTKQTCEDLIDMVGGMMSTIGRKKRIKTRVYFSEGGRKKAIDDLFKAFNTLASDPKALTEKVIEILKTGMEFQMPDYTIGADKIKKQSRKVYMTDENLWLQEDKKYVGMVELVNQELIKIVQDTIEGKGSPTLLAKEISKRTQ